MSYFAATLGLAIFAAGCASSLPEPVERCPVTEPKAALELTPPPAQPDRCEDGYRFADCMPDPEAPAALGTNLLVSNYEPTSSHGMAAPYDDALDRFVVADIARGVRLVDARKPESPVVTELMRIDGHPTAVRVAGDRALVLESSPTDDYASTLTWLSLSPTTVRAKLQTAALGAVRAVYSVSATPGSMVAILVTEEVRRTTECVRRTSTTLRKLELRDDGIYELDALDLGKDIAAIWRSGDWLLVNDQAPLRLGTLRFVRIRNGNGKLAAIAGGATPERIAGFAATEKELRVAAAHRLVSSDGPPYYMFGRAVLSTFEILPNGTITEPRTCEYERSSKPKNETAELVDPLFVDRVAFTDRGALFTVYEYDEHEAPGQLALVDGVTCQRAKLPGGIVLAGPADPLIAISSPAESPTLELQYRDPARPSASYPTLQAQLSKPPEAHPGASAYMASDARVHAAGTLSVLAMPFREHDAQGALRTGDQLVFSTPAGGVLGPTLEGPLWLINDEGRAVVHAATGLRVVQLHQGKPAIAIADVVLWPTYSSAVFVQSAPEPLQRRRIARLRAIAEPSTYDPHTGSPMGQLEIVAGDVNAQYGPALATFPVSANASLRSEGNLVIASSQEAKHARELPNGRCHITVIDAASKPVPRKVSFRVSNKPCPWRPTLTPAEQEREASSRREVRPDEMVLDRVDEERLLLRYGSLRRAPRNLVRLY